MASWYTPGLSDGLGDRLLMFDNSSAVPLELLRFPRPFSQSPTFETALRRRIEDLRDFSHPGIATVRSIQWLGVGDGLALVSNQVPGRRLSDVFGQARGPAYANELLRQLTAALAALEQHGPDISHGAINADRVVITEAGRLVLVEHVLGSALSTLYWPPSRARAALDVPVPPADRAIFDNRTDVYQLAFLALSVALGRRVHPTDDPNQPAALLAEAGRPGLTRAPLTAKLRHWLERALLLGGRSFASATEAHAVFINPVDEQAELKAAPPAAADSARPVTSEPATARVTQFRPKHSPDLFSTADLGAAAAASMPAPDSVAGRIKRIAATLPRVPRRWALPALGALVVVQALAIGVMATRGGTRAPTSVVIDGGQPGAQVLVDGKVAGLTPLKLNVGAATRSIQIAAVGASPAAAASATLVDISSDPPGAHVTVDGKAVGSTPLTLPVEPGPHDVAFSSGPTTVVRTVTVGAGSTATVVAALAPAGTGAGWLTIASPVELQVLENGAVIGTTTAERLMLPAGRHDLTLASPTLGFQTPLRVEVTAGKSSLQTVSVPNGSVSINALPWAAVTLDGRDLGSTPIANVDVPLGTHDVVFRHPQLGERRQSILVTAKTPVRLVVDLSKK